MESNKFPLISVGLITYNHEKYIEDCLKSILLQDYPYMELIILDDASTDDNVQIIENYLPELNNKFERVQFIKHKINSANIPKNYNEIESHIKGEFFFGVSGDDIIFADSITKLYNCFTRHQECALIYANGFYIDDNFHLGDTIDSSKVLIKNKDVSDEKNISFKKLMYGNTVCRPTVLIPSKIIKKYGPHDETLIYEDYEYWLRLLSNGEKFYFLNEPVVLYRRAEISCTNFNSKSIINNINRFKLDMEHDYLCKKKYVHLLDKSEQSKLLEAYYNYYKYCITTLPKLGNNKLLYYLDSLIKNKPKISFLVTYYNQKEYVKDSLDNILNLKISCEYEVLVGDDGSDDGTIEEVLKYRSKFKERLRIFKQNRDDCVTDNVLRVSNLRKRLLNESQGEYFMTLDGDDFYCDRDFLIEAFRILDTNSNISVVMFDYEQFYSNKIIKHKLNMNVGRHECNNYIRYNYYTHVGACVLRNPGKALMRNINQVSYYDDNEILIFQFNFGDIWYIDKCVYSYRQIDKSLFSSLSKPEKSILHILKADDGSFMTPWLKNCIYLRYKYHLLYVYFRRERMKWIIGEKHYEKILKFALDNDFFLSRNLLLPKSDSIVENEIEKIINMIIHCADDFKYYKNAKRWSEIFDNILQIIPPNKNIIIYGAGAIGKIYYNEISVYTYFNKILWVDKNYEIYKNLNVKSIECLKEANDYDYAIIAINDKKTANDVRNYLSSISALSNIQIIWKV